MWPFSQLFSRSNKKRKAAEGTSPGDLFASSDDPSETSSGDPTASSVEPSETSFGDPTASFVEPSEPSSGDPTATSDEPSETSSGDPTANFVEPSETPTSDDSAALAPSWGLLDTGREPPPRLEEELTIQAMYESWVELESSVSRAHDDLRNILADRERAASLRKEAEQVLLEGEAIREEARRIGELAWQAFDRGFAINPRGLASQSAKLREVEEAMKTQAALQRAFHRETWGEADNTRQKATADLIGVLMALRTAVVQVERELHEAASLPAVAESLKESAQEELRGAKAIRNELAFLGQEALNLLGAEPSRGERPLSQPQRPSLRSGEPEGNILPEIPQQAVQQPEAPQAIELPSENPAPSAAEELRREMEALRHPAEPLEGRVSSAAEGLANELAAPTHWSPSAATPSEEAPPPIGLEPRSPVIDQGEATPRTADLPVQAPAAAGDFLGPARPEDTPTPDPTPPLPQSYTGRFFLMFPASLSQDSLESVWEFLEDVAGLGTIADMRLVSQDAGVQFTMALGAKELKLDELRRRIPNAELVALAPDRLRVNWSG